MLRSFLGKEGSFRKNALIMSGGAALNVLISLGLYPIVTRLYTKEDFGVFGIYMAVVSTISLLATSLYPSGFVIPKLKREFYALFKLTIYLASVVLVLSMIFMFLLRPVFDFIFKTHNIGWLIYLIPIGVIINILLEVYTNWNVRNKLFKNNAVAAIGSSVSTKLSNIICGITSGSSSIGLIASQKLGSVVSIFLLGFIKLSPKLAILKKISNKEIFDVAKKYKKYPLNLLPGNFVNRYTSDLPIYLLTAYFNPAITGAFVLANQMMNIPLNVIGKSISSVFLQKSNELYHSDPGSMSNFARKANIRMLLLGNLAFGFVFGFGDLLFAFAFGAEWLIAGEIAAILSIYCIIKLVSGPLAGIFRVVGKEQYSLYVSLILAVGRSVGMYYGVMTGDVLTAILYFTIGNLVGYIVTMMFVFSVCRLPVIKLTMQTLVVSITSFLFFFGFRYLVDQVIDIKSMLVPIN